MSTGGRRPEDRGRRRSGRAQAALYHRDKQGQQTGDETRQDWNQTGIETPSITNIPMLECSVQMPNHLITCSPYISNDNNYLQASDACVNARTTETLINKGKTKPYNIHTRIRSAQIHKLPQNTKGQYSSNCVRIRAHATRAT